MTRVTIGNEGDEKKGEGEEKSGHAKRMQMKFFSERR